MDGGENRNRGFRGFGPALGVPSRERGGMQGPQRQILLNSIKVP